MDQTTVFNEIAAAARALGAEASAHHKPWKDSIGREYNPYVLEINGYDVSYYVDLKARMPARVSTWSKRDDNLPKKYSLSIGAYGMRKLGQRTSLPQKKDGSFSWDKAAELLIRIADSKKREQTGEKRRVSNDEVLKALQAEIPGLLRHSAIQVRASTHADFPIDMTLSFKGFYSVERVREIHAALESVGLAHFD